MSKRASLVSVLFVSMFSMGTMVFAQDTGESLIDSSGFKPYMTFSVGGGVTRFMGDVQDQSEKANVHMLGNRATYDLNIGVALSRSFVLNLNGVYGKLSGNENTFKQHRNFESQMVLAGLNIEYNFAGFWKKRLPVLNPFITAGAYYGMYFNTVTDIAYGDDNEYFYWSDGRIRDVAEDALNSDDAELISRDYEYETSLNGGPVHTFTASAGLGLDLHLSRSISVRLMSRYFYAVSDKVDGYATSGMTDGFFFNQLSLVVNTQTFSKKRRGEEAIYKYLFDVSQLENIESEDLDNDGVLDMVDKCANTPAGVQVDKNGCPLDNDGDGIADYRDADINTVKGEIVTPQGEAVDYELEEQRWSDSQGARVISWDKRYTNPRYAKEENYAVSFSVSKGDKFDEQSLLKKYPKLMRKELSDSLIVFNMGTYEKFESAQEQSRVANSELTHDAFVVKAQYAEQVAAQLASINIPDSVSNKDSYGVAESIEQVKKSESFTFPQLEYTLSRFEDHLANGVPEYALVEQYLRGIAPFTWDKMIKDSYVDVSAKLKENPVIRATDLVVVTPAELTENGSEPEKQLQPDTNTLAKPLLAEFKLSPKAKLDFMPVSEKFELADLNQDGLIGYQEIEKVLNGIIEGSFAMEVEDFNEMVVEFTDFTENVDPIDFGGTKAAYFEGRLTIFKPQNTELKKDARQLLAAKYSEADFNGDGELSADEVQKMITLFMDGKTDFPSEKVYELIDLYFD